MNNEAYNTFWSLVDTHVALPIFIMHQPSANRWDTTPAEADATNVMYRKLGYLIYYHKIFAFDQWPIL